ncbi:MAG: thioredoxin family protein [Aliarcobacter sp.]|nr:thioredoxin family protein [Aliarcobacter sp.]
MLEIQTIEQIKKEIDSKEPILIYFSGENCSVCKVLKPKIENEVINNFSRFKLYEVKTDIYKEITSEFTVFSIPTIIVYFDSKEFKRYGRNMSIPLFIDEIKRPYKLMCE